MTDEKILNILLCDDDPVDRKLVKAYLKKISHYNCQFAEAGEEEEILMALDEGNIDLIFLDVQMPGRTGLEWLSELNNRKVAPVIILTGHGSELIAVDAMKNGATDYLPKSKLNSENLNRIIDNALEKWTLQKQLEEYRVKLEHLAQTDELTGLMNRRSIMGQLVEELNRSVRYNRPLSLLMIDMDNFKTINDVYGHLVGDKVMENTAKIIINGKRCTDFAGRYGGDEFVIILPETTLNGAKEIGERIRSEIEHSVVTCDEIQSIKYTISLGVAQLPILDADQCSTEGLLKKADAALYNAKKNGGNLVCE